MSNEPNLPLGYLAFQLTQCSLFMADCSFYNCSMGSELDRLAQEVKAARAKKQQAAAQLRERIGFMETQVIPLLDEAVENAVAHYQRLTEARGLDTVILLEQPPSSIAGYIRELDRLPKLERSDWEAQVGVAIIGVGTFNRYFIITLSATHTEPRLRAALKCSEDRDGRLRRLTATLSRSTLRIDEGEDFKPELVGNLLQDFVEALIDDCIRITREKG